MSVESEMVGQIDDLIKFRKSSQKVEVFYFEQQFAKVMDAIKEYLIEARIQRGYREFHGGDTSL